MKIALLNLSTTADFRDDARRSCAVSSVSRSGHQVSEFYAGDISGKARAETLNAAADQGVEIAWIVLGGESAIDVLPFVDWHLLKAKGTTVVGTSDATHLAWKCLQYEIPFVYAFDLANVGIYFPQDCGMAMIGKVVDAVQMPKAVTRKILANAGVRGRTLMGGHTAVTAFMSQLCKIDTRSTCLFLEYHHSTETTEEALYWFHQIAYLIRVNVLSPDSILLGHNELQDVDDVEFRKQVAGMFEAVGVRDIGYIDHYVAAIPFSR